MKTGFHDPDMNKIKEKSQRSPWNFDQPPYDERSSCYINAGSHRGVGHKNPIGHTDGVKQRVPTLPYGKHKGMKIDVVPRKNLNLEIDV